MEFGETTASGATPTPDPRPPEALGGVHGGRLYALLAEEIASGVRRPGERLPPERALASDFGVSRSTVRRALTALAAEGLVESHIGRGTFVAGGHLGEPPNVLMSFTELGRTHRLTPSARVLAQQVRDATIDEAGEFGIAPGAPLFHLERVRFLDRQPIAVDLSTVPLAVCPGLPDLDFTTASVYETLTAHDAEPVRAHYTVEAHIASESVAELLETAAGAALLVAHTRGYDERDRLVELGRTTYRSDRYRFEATLRRRRQPWSLSHAADH